MSSDKPRNLRPTIGLLSEVGASGSSYYTNLWAGFVDAAQELDVNLICYVGGTINVSQYGFDTQRNILFDQVSGERVDGLLICGALGNFITTEEFRGFVDRYRPLPMVGIAQTPGTPNVIVDNEKGIRDLVTHLIEVHGYRRIAFIRGPEGNQEAELRYRAYAEALGEHGLPLDPDLVALGAFVYETGIDAIRLLLDERKAKFDAVVAANDWMALGALKALGDRGIRVPEDIALAGFDDTREAAASRPSLTTVRQPIHQLGRTGIEVLLDLLAGKQVPEQTFLPTRLMVRQSCGCSEPVVAHAAVGPLERKKEPLEQAVVARREEILSEMMQVVEASVSSSSEWASRLLNAFMAEMVPGSVASKLGAESAPQASFLSTLDDVLRQAVAASAQVEDFQEVISVMRRHLLPYLADVAILSQAEDLFSQGRVMIGRVAQWDRARQEVEEAQQAEVRSYFSGDLVTAIRREQILDVLVHRLPQLGFSSFYLSFYEGRERPAAWSRLMLAHDSGERVEVSADGWRFSTGQLVPDALFPRERRYTWVVESLNSRENQFGYIIFEAGSRAGEIYGTLSRQISGALQDSLLIQQLENRSIQLMTAADVSRSASSLLAPDELMQQVVALVRERFSLYYAGLFLVDDVRGAPGEWAVLRAGTGEAGQRMLEQGHRLKVGGESMIGWCVANKRARIALDVGEEAVRFDNPLLPETRSELALPLVSRGQAIGALTIQSAEEAAFTEEDIAVLQTLADQVATAIANARLYKALAQEQYLMNALMDNVPDYIYFKDAESRFVRTTVAQGRKFGLSDPAEAIGKTDFDFFTEEHARPAYEDEQKIIRTGQPILGVEERETWPDGPDTWVLTSKLPLRDEQGNIVGTFGISSDITARKQAEETLERRAVQLQTAAEVSHAASSILDPDELIQQVVDLVRERYGLYYAGLFLVDDSGMWAVLRAGTGEAGQKMVEQGHKLEVGGESMIGWCTANGQARITQHAGQEAVRLANPLLPGTRSEMALPLIARGQVVGAMTIHSEEEAAFAEEDIAALQAMAGQIANAIANTRLFEQAQNALREMEATHRRYLQQAWTEYLGTAPVTSYETGHPDTPPLGDKVLPEIQKAMQNQGATVLAGHGEEGEDASALVVPVTLRGQALGALGIHGQRGTERWTDEEIALVEAVAERMAITAESLRLLDETQRRATREQLTSEVATRLRQTLDLETVVRTAAREMGQALNLHDLTIRLKMDGDESE